MIVQQVTRGASVLFSARFLDVGGVAIVPTTRTIRFRQRDRIETHDMDLVGSAYEYLLQTDGWQPGVVYYTVVGTGGSASRAQEDGSLTLTANPANQI